MSRIWSFHGGIHPPENKQQSLQEPLIKANLPPRLILPLQQHIGLPAEPLVKIGERVLKGQCIAEPVGHISVSIHAPTSGTVVAIGNHPVPHSSGMEALCIQIDTDGIDEWVELQGIEDYRQLEKAQLTDVIRRAGIAGLGGAGFPTDIKLHLGDDHIVNTLILNGVECEPYITADDILMRERADEIVKGLEISAHLIQPTHCMIGIEDNKPEAAIALTEAARNSKLDIEVVVLPTKYPSGGERQLIKLLTGVEVPSGKLPADIGIVVQNVGTVSSVYQAVRFGRPLISRITTITGEAVNHPRNLEVLLGTPISHLLEQCEIDRNKLSRLIMGGPMMGFTLNSDRLPVVKTSNCVIAATTQEFPPQPQAQACIRCGSCEQACPAELLPQQLYWFAKSREFDKALSHNLLDCIECGACAYVCPSNIPLVQYYRYAKSEVRLEQQEQRKSEQARIRFEARQERLEREKLEKANRRTARAQAAAQAQADKKATPPKADAPPSAANGSSDEDAEAQLKTLKTKAAVARTKLKKAEKTLALAETENGQDLDALKADLQVQQVRTQDAQQAFEQAEKTLQAMAPQSETIDIKALKTAAAVARTKVKKTEKALADAEAKGLPSADKLRDALSILTQKLEAAERALKENEGSPSTPPLVDIKQLKTAAAIARTKLKKTEKTLQQALADSSPEVESLTTALNEQRTKTEAAQQALAEAEQSSSLVTCTGTQPAVDIEALKAAAVIARTKVKKTETALAAAEAKGLPSADKLKGSVEALRQKAEEAQKAFEQAEQSA
jgi:electron transport complex protein RnfC